MKDLIKVGSRVMCGLSHRGTLAGYFTGPASYDEHDVDTLYGIIKLDKGYWTKPEEDGYTTHVSMLVVHIDNLEIEREKKF